MTLNLDPSKLNGLNAIVARLNAVEGAEQTTPEDYLTVRVNEILDSYTTQDVEKVKAENASFFDLAATLPAEVQQQLRDLISSAVASS